MSNRVTLEQALGMTVTELGSLPIDQIVLLLEDVATLKASAKRADDHLFSVLNHMFADRAAEVRKEKGADTGTVRLVSGDFVVVADLPKKVEWDQAGLRDVEATLAAMGEPPADYIKVKRDVSEAAFKGWPSSLKKMFEPHRTVGAGKPTYKIEAKKREAA